MVDEFNNNISHLVVYRVVQQPVLELEREYDLQEGDYVCEVGENTFELANDSSVAVFQNVTNQVLRQSIVRWTGAGVSVSFEPEEDEAHSFHVNFTVTGTNG